jgi:hypothetical protein
MGLGSGRPVRPRYMHRTAPKWGPLMQRQPDIASRHLSPPTNTWGHAPRSWDCLPCRQKRSPATGDAGLLWVPWGGTVTGEGIPRQHLDYNTNLTLRLPDKNQLFWTLGQCAAPHRSQHATRCKVGVRLPVANAKVGGTGEALPLWRGFFCFANRPQQFRQLSDIDSNAPRFIKGQHASEAA